MYQFTLCQMRKAVGKTLQEMADFLEIDRATYTRWEETPSKISIENCYKICEFLGIDYDKSIFLP